jgi:ankyrin repeat protein
MIRRNLPLLHTLILHIYAPEVFSEPPVGPWNLQHLEVRVLGDQSLTNAVLTRCRNLRFLHLEDRFSYTGHRSAEEMRIAKDQFCDTLLVECPSLETLSLGFFSSHVRLLQSLKTLVLKCVVRNPTIPETPTAMELLAGWNQFVGIRLALSLATVFKTPGIRLPRTPLSILEYFVITHNKEGVEYVLNAGADPNLSFPDFPYMMTALDLAVRDDNIDMLRLLLRYRADATRRDRRTGGSVFHAAVRANARKCTKFLVSKEVLDECEKKDPDLFFLRTFSGRTLLHEAVAAAADRSLVKHLLKNLKLMRTQVSEKDCAYNGPLHQAVSSSAIAELLIAHGADFNQRNGEGNAPISYQTGEKLAGFMNLPSLRLDSVLLEKWGPSGLSLAAETLLCCGHEIFRHKVEPFKSDNVVLRVVRDYDCDMATLLVANAHDFEKRFGANATFAALQVLFDMFPILAGLNQSCSRIVDSPALPQPSLDALPGGHAIHFAGLTGDQHVANLLLQRRANPNAFCSFPAAKQTRATALSIVCHVFSQPQSIARPNGDQHRIHANVLATIEAVIPFRAKICSDVLADMKLLESVISYALTPIGIVPAEETLAVWLLERLIQSFEAPLSDMDKLRGFEPALPTKIFLDALVVIVGYMNDHRNVARSMDKFGSDFARRVLQHYAKQRHKFCLSSALVLRIIEAGSHILLRVFAVEFPAAMISGACLDALLSNLLPMDEALEMLRVLITALRPRKAEVEKMMRPSLRRAFIKSASWKDKAFHSEIAKVYSVKSNDPQDLGKLHCSIS